MASVTVRVLVCLLGVGISYYAFDVDQKIAENPDHEATCDFPSLESSSFKVSCTTAFNSEYGKGFGIICPIAGEDSPLCQKNSLYGIVNYALMIPLVLMQNVFAAEVLLIISLGSIVISIFLAYVLVLLKTVCLVCIGTYVINIVLLKQNWQSRKEIMAMKYADLEIEQIKKDN